MNDVRPVLRDDLLLDRLALGERPEDAGAVEDLLLALRADSLLAVPLLDAAPSLAPVEDLALAEEPEPTTRPAPVPAPRVVRLRSTFAGALVAAAVVSGTCGVAAAATGDPLAGLHGLRDAVLVASSAEGRPPLMRSEAGAALHDRIEEAAALLAAGRTEEAAALMEQVGADLPDVPAGEHAILLGEIDATGPRMLEAARLSEHAPGSVPGAVPGLPGTTLPGSATASAPDDDDGKPSRTTKPGKGTPGSPTSPAASAPSGGATVPPVATTPPGTTAPPTSTPPTTAPPTTSSGYAPPPPSSTHPGRGTGSPTSPGNPSKPPKPTKPPKSGEVEPSSTTS